MSVTFRAAGAYVSGTANLTPGIPVGAAAGDMMLCFHGCKPYNTTATIDQGWSTYGSATSGSVPAAVDAGSMQMQVFYKEHTGTESNPTITSSNNNVSGAIIIVFQRSLTGWVALAGAGGGDDTAHSGAYSVQVASNPGITSGDVLVGFAATPSDSVTQSGITITEPSIGVGSFTEPVADLTTTSGTDMSMSGGYVAVTSGTATVAPTYASTMTNNSAARGACYVMRLRDENAAVPVGNSLETDTALGLGVARPAVVATETDTAQALAAVQLQAVGMSTETDTAQALAAVQLQAAGVAAETDTALALAAGGTVAAGMAAETDEAQALAPVQLQAAGVADESDAATVLGVARPVGLAVGTEVATTLGSARPVEMAVEVDTALALSSGLLVGAGLETDTALALAAVQLQAAGTSTEADTAQALAVVQVRAAGVSLETDEAQAPTAVQIGATRSASETDTALAAGTSHEPGTAVEVDTALTLAGARPAGAGMETDTALALAAVQVRATGAALETDWAGTLAVARSVGIAVEVDAALQLTRTRFGAIVLGEGYATKFAEHRTASRNPEPRHAVRGHMPLSS